VNRALLRLSMACLVMFVLLLINVNYVQAFESTSLSAEPGNVRVFYQQFQYQRGSILATGDDKNVKIALSRQEKGGNRFYLRQYPDGPAYAPVTGYDSVYSKTGIEAAENKELAGTASSLQVHNLISLITGKPKLGATVSLTISPRAQQAAYAALVATGHQGGVVAINPRTGAILALASYPSYNPNGYTTLDGQQLNRTDARYRHDPNQPLLNRALNATYPPGSSAKVITSAAAFSTGKVANPNTPVAAPNSLPIGNGNTLVNDNNETCGSGNPPIIQAFWLSCNTAFGKLGIKVGRALHHYASAFGANNPNLTIPLPVSESVIPTETDPAFTAFTAIGQFNDRVTPMQEAMLSAAVANGGTLMKPYLVQSVQAPDLQTIDSAKPIPLGRPVSPQVAGFLTQMMKTVTQNPAGTAFATANSSLTGGIVIAGKTGTAQNGVNNTNLDDAVFTAFAPADNPKIAVGVIVKGGGFGAAAAAPIAVKVIQAYLKQS
jgi:peptidoglycan glycosyltransferase